MNEFLIKQYINNITKDDIQKFANLHGLVLNNNEIIIIFAHIKKNWRTIIYGNPREILNKLKTEVEPLTYSKIEELYKFFKVKYNHFIQ